MKNRCAEIADAVVPEYRNGRRSYSCAGTVGKRWQAAYEAAAIGFAIGLAAARSEKDDVLAEAKAMDAI